MKDEEIFSETFETPYGTVTGSINYGSDAHASSNNPTELSIESMSEIESMLSVPRANVVCIDIETTGLRYSSDEILQVTICDGDGNILFDSYTRPSRHKSWPKAQEVNHITWDMVKDSPSIVDVSFEIEDILNNASLIIGFNINRFDFEFLKRGRIDVSSSVKVYDLIDDCSVIYGKWSNHYENYSFVSLQKMADVYGIKYDAHNSLNDVVATTKVFYSFLKDKKLVSKVEATETRRYQIAEAKRKKEEERIAAEKEERKRIEKEKEAQENRAKGKRLGCNIILICIIIVLVTMLVSCISDCSSRSSRSSKLRYSINYPSVYCDLLS